MARRHFSNLRDAVDHCRRERMKRAKPKLSGDLRLRSGERAHNRMVMEELARQQKAKKQAKKKDA